MNGKEVARGNMPAGPVEPDTLADDYPPETFFGPDGKLLKENWNVKDPETIAGWTRIKRRLDASVPARPPAQGRQRPRRRGAPQRLPQGLRRRDRKASGWAAVSFVRSTCGVTEPDADVAGRTGRAAQHGAARGRAGVEFVAAGGGPVRLRRPARAAPARGHRRPAATARSRARCRSARGRPSRSCRPRRPISSTRRRTPSSPPPRPRPLGRDGQAPRRGAGPARSPYALWAYAEAPAELPGAVQPVSITVRVPKDAAPGDYAGTLTLAAEGAGPFAVPVRRERLAVHAPGPDATTRRSSTSSSRPTRWPLHYGVPLWSRRALEADRPVVRGARHRGTAHDLPSRSSPRRTSATSSRWCGGSRRPTASTTMTSPCWRSTSTPTRSTAASRGSCASTRGTCRSRADRRGSTRRGGFMTGGR